MYIDSFLRNGLYIHHHITNINYYEFFDASTVGYTVDAVAVHHGEDLSSLYGSNYTKLTRDLTDEDIRFTNDERNYRLAMLDSAGDAATRDYELNLINQWYEAEIAQIYYEKNSYVNSHFVRYKSAKMFIMATFEKSSNYNMVNIKNIRVKIDLPSIKVGT